MVACKRFGAGTNKQLWKDPAKRFKDKQAHRMSEPLEPEFVQDDYPDCRIKRTHRGDLEIDCMVPEKGYSEKWNWNGTHQVDYEDGSQGVGVTGTCQQKYKQGKNSTTQFSGDDKTGNHSRTNVGHDGQASGAKGLQVGGGRGDFTYGNIMAYNSGMSGTVSGGPSWGGFHGTIGGRNIDVGLTANPGKGGLGHGVSNKGTLLSTVRQKHDGEHIIQIMPPPNSETGGVVTVQHKPDGTIIITSQSTQTTTNGGNHTINAPKIILNGDVHITGAVTTDSTIKSSGDHTAPEFHGCADKAKGKC